MIQREFEELLEQFSQDELNEKSTVKGQFTSYITRRMEWHAIRYAAKNRPNVIVISLDQAPRHLTDIDAEQMLTESRAVNEAVTWEKSSCSYPGRSCRRQVGESENRSNNELQEVSRGHSTLFFFKGRAEQS